MRIGNYGQVNQVYGTNKGKKSDMATTNPYGSIGDEVSFSTIGKDMQVAKSALVKTPDIREDLVSKLKAKIESGNYNVNPDDFAAKLISTYEKNLI